MFVPNFLIVCAVGAVFNPFPHTGRFLLEEDVLVMAPVYSMSGTETFPNTEGTHFVQGSSVCFRLWLLIGGRAWTLRMRPPRR